MAFGKPVRDVVRIRNRPDDRHGLFDTAVEFVVHARRRAEGVGRCKDVSVTIVGVGDRVTSDCL